MSDFPTMQETGDCGEDDEDLAAIFSEALQKPLPG